MSAAGQLHAIMFWILRSYCLRLNTGELCKMKTINQIDATDVFFFLLVLCVCATIGIIVFVWQWYCQPQTTTLANNDSDAYHAT